MPIASAQFIANMRARRGRNRDPRKVILPVWLHPVPVARLYRRELLALVRAMNKTIADTVFPQLPQLVIQADFELRADSYADNVEIMYNNLAINLDTQFNEVRIKNMVTDIGQKTSEWNNRQWQKTLRRVLGVDLFTAEPWLTPLMDAWVKDNVALIKSIKTDSVRKIEGMTTRALSQGKRHETIKKEIVREFGVSKRRAELIARDQVSKLNGNLTNRRQTELGITHYLWRTSMDERVRPSHRAHDFVKFRWDTPPAGTGHPGEDIQCRCTAEPVFKSVLDTAGIKTSVFPPRRRPRAR